MSPQKLLELALLDASGVLDHHESVEFERAFADADDDLKALVRCEQARFADVTEILPDVAPRPELRSRVIDAVLEASGKHRDAAGETILAHAAAERATDGRRHQRSGMMWRIGTFAFATAFAAMGVMAFQLNQQFAEISDRIAGNANIDTLLGIGEQPDFFSALIDESYQRTALSTGDSDAQAAVLISEDSGDGYIAFRRLPALEPGSRYVLVALGDGDEILSQLARFNSGGETNVIGFDIEGQIGNRFALAVETPTGLEIMYRSA